MTAAPVLPSTTLRARRARCGVSALGAMRVPWAERASTTLSDLYDADLRHTAPRVAAIAATYVVPHPLADAIYAPARDEATS